MGISLVVARTSTSNPDLIEEFTYYDGRPHGIATMWRKGSGRLVAEHWYEEGRLATSHLYSLCGEWIETVMEYTGDAVSEYWRYDSRGNMVDYENYADMPEYGSQLRYAVTVA
jgi:antitoxin component YwqK of YwqJK toxin-antitoxin module